MGKTFKDMKGKKKMKMNKKQMLRMYQKKRGNCPDKENEEE